MDCFRPEEDQLAEVARSPGVDSEGDYVRSASIDPTSTVPRYSGYSLVPYILVLERVMDWDSAISAKLCEISNVFIHLYIIGIVLLHSTSLLSIGVMLRY